MKRLMLALNRKLEYTLLLELTEKIKEISFQQKRNMLNRSNRKLYNPKRKKMCFI